MCVESLHESSEKMREKIATGVKVSATNQMLGRGQCASGPLEAVREQCAVPIGGGSWAVPKSTNWIQLYDAQIHERHVHSSRES